MNVKTVKLKDINDRELLYVVIENGGRKESINVGIKTFTKIENLLKGQELPLPDGKNQLAGKMDK